MSDLEAQLVLARDDMRRLADALRLAFDLDLGYGPGAQSYEPRVSVSHDASPVLSDGSSPTIAAAVRLSLQHLAKAHWWYGELPDGQTVWPVEALEQRDVSLPEILYGVATLDLVLAELQRTRATFVSVQESAYALAVANHASEALRALPDHLWRHPPEGLAAHPDERRCPGVGPAKCGKWIPWAAKRCNDCQQRAEFLANPDAYLHTAPVCVDCGRDVQDRGSRCWKCRQARHRASV